MRQHEFTLIKMMVAVSICGILFLLVAGATGGQGNLSFGINGLTESRCIEGYKFVIGEHGQARQILDEFGKGVRCENPNAGKPGSFGKM